MITSSNEGNLLSSSLASATFSATLCSPSLEDSIPGIQSHHESKMAKPVDMNTILSAFRVFVIMFFVLNKRLFL